MVDCGHNSSNSVTLYNTRIGYRSGMYSSVYILSDNHDTNIYCGCDSTSDNHNNSLLVMAKIYRRVIKMNIEDIEISIISECQTILTDDGIFQCSGCLIESNRVIISDRDAYKERNISNTVNHEFLHIILEEIDSLQASQGLDMIDGFYTYPIVL